MIHLIRVTASEEKSLGHFPRELCLKWRPFREATEDDDDEEEENLEFRLPGDMVAEDVFDRLIKVHHVRSLDTYYTEPTLPIHSSNFKDYYKFDGYEPFLVGDSTDLTEQIKHIMQLMKLADYLDDQFLKIMLGIKLGTILYEKTTPEAAKILNVEADLESPEYLEFRKQNVWVEKTNRDAMIKRMNEIKNTDVDNTLDPRPME